MSHAKFNGSLSIKATKKSRCFLGANTKRAQAMFYNNSKNILYLNYDDAASLTKWVVKLLPDGYFELPQPIFPGGIFGIWDGEDGYCRVTELIS
jgi:hypothetical protein